MNIAEPQQQRIQPMPVWGRVSERSTPSAGVSSGHNALDVALGGNGWQQAELTEILIARAGVGEVSLLLPAVAHITQQKRWLALVAPPHLPYAPALVQTGVDLSRVLLVHPSARHDALSTVERALRAGTCGAVLAWLAHADFTALRRLQLAAEAGNSWAVVFRPLSVAQLLSPAALRLKLEPLSASGRTLAVQILKRRGGAPSARLVLDMEHASGRDTSGAVAS
ncbi:MAG: translesion DNA synthesis-associated protein ImuA [Gammaproteobacteria bacterium]|nr:translesion DNA synthesis-associated protein ImuA [Gammaproteobacteria bacterium]